MSILEEILFPKHCLVCKGFGNYFCDNCYKKLDEINTQVCIYCFKPSLLGLTHISCKKKWGIDGFISLYHYHGVAGRLIKSLKYKLVEDAFKDVLSKMKDEIKYKLSFLTYFKPIVVPIPLHEKRLAWRGFNQSIYISRYTSTLLGFNHSPTILLRRKNTTPQSTLVHEARKKNLKNAFMINVEQKKLIEKKTVLIVDDVVTTGYTVREAAKALKKNGAEKVFVFSIARG